MKIVIFGSTGFIGRELVKLLKSESDHTVIESIDSVSKNRVDLLDKNAIESFLRNNQPDVVINCAGIVDNSEIADSNPVFTANLIEAVAGSGIVIRQIIITGSAAEYGELLKSDVPVDEYTPTNPKSIYGKSKLEETTKALELAKKYKLNVTIVRIFNPIGKNMHPKFLVSKLIKQVNEIKSGKSTEIEVNRLDAKRDYIDVRDITSAIRVMAENKPLQDVYNVGSGIATSNENLLKEVVANSGLTDFPKIHEVSNKPEPRVAEQADVTRIKKEFGWTPKYTLKQTVKWII